ncbi:MULTISPECIES: hypothetical protein [Bacillus]|uniref:Uncharacterized protein n=3 Tax=Bacillus pseudomycoides TaxID=64104 RepID=A0AAJ3RAH2_9BACI|nr:hypothetical protein [Bacillus pseudomycoides]EEM09091.1 hypothetical protein bmyco0003_41510 [Bacillus pseudomycoides]KFN12726.1 putative membrane protein [Bacillus pseudomycoides]MBD5798790.1 hypothetical protein [Bacillus pseudomycoides]MCR8857454.1 hypothetical protein [Bacillus pseudomycoides]MDR4189123.1 hypothetical protein [Bacillus pseudomycoides]
MSDMYMPMEQGVREYLVTGSYLVVIVSLILLIYWFIKYKEKHIIWFIAHFLTLSLSLFLLITLLIGPNFSNYNMASEEKSLQLALSGITWVVSILFLLKGISEFIK